MPRPPQPNAGPARDAGTLEHQDPDVDTNSNVCLVLVLALVAVVPCTLVLYLLGCPWAALVGAAHVLVLGLLFLALSIHILFGGGPGGAAHFAVAFTAPTFTIVLGLGEVKAVAMLVLILAVGLATAVVEQAAGPEYVSPQLYVLPPFWHAAFYWININVSQAVSFGLMALTYRQMQAGRRRLEASKRKVDALCEELEWQQDSLQQQQRLTHRLVQNVFPRGVSESLIDLVRRCAQGRPSHESAYQAVPR